MARQVFKRRRPHLPSAERYRAAALRKELADIARGIAQLHKGNGRKDKLLNRLRRRELRVQAELRALGAPVCMYGKALS